MGNHPPPQCPSHLDSLRPEQESGLRITHGRRVSTPAVPNSSVLRRFLLFLFLTVLLPFAHTPELKAASATQVDLAVAAPVAISFAAPVTASPEAPVPPQSAVEKVIHVWVDPIYGDDDLAAARNPKFQVAYCNNAPTYPVDYVDGNGAILLNVPWPFKTVTAAIAYIPTLPHTSATTNVVWKYAVIHALPGMYAKGARTAIYPVGAPSNPGQHYKHNGIPPNGETFPIMLPERVSLQGTSARNTLFRLEEIGQRRGTSVKGTAGFLFGLSGPVFGDVPVSGEGTFIDSISIFGATPDSRWLVTQPTPTDREKLLSHSSLAAIYMGPEKKCNPTITNCWIFGNVVGILLDNPKDKEWLESGDNTWHTPVIANNTIAWNRCGIWNGQSIRQTTAPGFWTEGFSRPVLLNNIIDATPPRPDDNPWKSLPNWPARPFPSGWSRRGVTAFEGIAREDLTIQSPANVASFDSNAYEKRQLTAGGSLAYGGGFNWGFLISGLPNTRVPPASPFTNTWLTPGFDISPYTGCLLYSATLVSNNGRRGVLYISDLMRNGPFEKGNTTGFDWSPGDFRLSPFVADATFGPTAAANAPGGANGGPNPLVDRGFYPSDATHPLPVTMQNGQVMAQRPGTLTLNGVAYGHDSWDEDCEGWGNPRVWMHGMNGWVDYRGPIDVGADELGAVPIGGERFGSTRFMSFALTQLPTGVAPITGMDNKYAWLLGPTRHPSYLPGNTWSPDADPPRFRKIYPTVPPQGQESWFADWQFQPTNYTYYIPPETRITPHLLKDIHPHWKFSLGWPSNPIWQGAPVPPGSQPCYALFNPSLFWNPDFGVINPPGTLPTTGSGYAWLDGSGTSPQYVPLNTTASVVAPLPITYDSFDDWCVGQKSGAVPIKQKYTFRITRRVNKLEVVRYSVENTSVAPPYALTLSDRNIQSFDVVVEEPPK